jgi:hypothetical protein
MIRWNGRPVIRPGRRSRRRSRGRRGLAPIAVAVLVGSTGLAGCGLGKAVSAVRRVTHDVRANKATIDEFTSGIKASSPATFEATYRTTGTSPTRVVYAVRPPHELAFRSTPTDGGSDGTAGSTYLIVNTHGEFSCTPGVSPAAAGSRWTCEKLGAAGAATRNQILGFYTPAHWVSFLRDFSLAAGFAGDKVGSSHLTAHGFSMRCVDFVAAGVTGTSRICTTAQNILGYVKVASDTTSFEITSYSAAPPAALFRLPPHATITQPSARPAG